MRCFLILWAALPLSAMANQKPLCPRALLENVDTLVTRRGTLRFDRVRDIQIRLPEKYFRDGYLYQMACHAARKTLEAVQVYRKISAEALYEDSALTLDIRYLSTTEADGKHVRSFQVGVCDSDVDFVARVDIASESYADNYDVISLVPLTESGEKLDVTAPPR